MSCPNCNCEKCWRDNPWKDDGISGYMFAPTKREKRRFDALVDRLSDHLEMAAEVLAGKSERYRERVVFMVADGPVGLVCLIPYYIGFDNKAEDRWYLTGDPKSLSLGAVGRLSQRSPKSDLSGPSKFHIRSEMIPKGGWPYMTHIPGYRGLAPGSAFYYTQYVGMNALEEALDIADSMDWDEYFRYTRNRCDNPPD